MLEQIKDDEESIRSTLVNAQKAGEKIINDANERANAIVNGIKSRCDEVLKKFRAEANEEVNNIWRIRTNIIDFKQKLYTLYTGHLEDLQNLSVNDLTDIIIPDTGKIITDIVADASKEFKRDLEENNDIVSETEDADIKDNVQQEAIETVVPSDDVISENNYEVGANSSDSDDIDDFIKLIEEKANE